MDGNHDCGRMQRYGIWGCEMWRCGPAPTRWVRMLPSNARSDHRVYYAQCHPIRDEPRDAVDPDQPRHSFNGGYPLAVVLGG